MITVMLLAVFKSTPRQSRFYVLAALLQEGRSRIIVLLGKFSYFPKKFGKEGFYFPESEKSRNFLILKKTVSFCQIEKNSPFFYFPESGKEEFLLLDLPVEYDI